MPEATYTIIRFFENDEREVIVRGLTLAQAQAHCSDPETSSNTATSEPAVRRTKERGRWFDGYEMVE